jgi:glycosyltransferase involved in cell wall biosynthesis
MVSIVCAVMNRAPALRVALTSWRLQQDVTEIVIVDWNSDIPLTPLAQEDERIQVIRVDHEPHFHLAAAFNLAADCASRPVLLKLDADYVLNPYYRFCASHPLPEQGFFTGHFRNQGPFASFLNGLICVRTADWRRVHGYNEHLEGYGWEDDDFYLRLKAAGLNRWILSPDPATAFHIPHEHGERVRHYDDKDVQRAHQRNRALATQTAYTHRRFTWDLAPVSTRVQRATKRPDGTT